MTRWAMTADLERCVGCQTCTAACRHANATSPAVQWRKVLDVESGTYPQVSRTFVPVGCQHCAEPPCMNVCPSTATRRRPDGIVTIDYDLCIGCSYCAVACPYQARFKVEGPRFAFGITGMQSEAVRDDPRRVGVAQKCTFCVDRIDAGIAAGLTPGIDPRATPACVNACIADALQFGDLDDPSSNVSRLLAEHAHGRMHEEIGTAPAFYYLHGRRSEAADRDAAAQVGAAPAIRAKGVQPSQQTQWDWRAAANFVCGGAGAGLFAFVALAALSGVQVAAPGLCALMLVAVGLFLVWLEIGRPWRIVNVLLHPQQSWMTREAAAAAVFLALAVPSQWVGSAALTAIAGAAGLAFLYCQARILKAAKGIPAWRSRRIVPLIVTSGLAEGAGLFLTAAALLPAYAPVLRPAVAAFVLLIAIRALAWRAYRRALAASGAPTRTLEIIAASAWSMTLFGMLAPLALALAAHLLPGAQVPLLMLAGLSACLAGSACKVLLITRAAFNQGFALAHVPMRGSGRAGAPAKPGWSMP